MPSESKPKRRVRVAYIWFFLIFSAVLLIFGRHPSDSYSSVSEELANLPRLEPQSQQLLAGRNPQINPLGIPPGKAQNLPSVSDKKEAVAGTEQRIHHLGGHADLDLNGVSPNVWKHMIQDHGVHSFLDVGCGRGVTASWFHLHGADVLCVEGSHNAIKQSVLSSNLVVEHDYRRGPWWPEKTYDVAWAVNFVEHVNLQHQFNYVNSFRKAALVFVTTSLEDGSHHVEVHEDSWWIRKFESYGLQFDQALTDQVRKWASEETQAKSVSPVGSTYNAQHIQQTMKVFMNPVVAALPEHAHLFPEFGCYGGRKDGQIVHRECGKGREGKLETPLSKSLYPLKLTPDMDQKWEDLVRENFSSSLFKSQGESTAADASNKVMPAKDKQTSSQVEEHANPELIGRLKQGNFTGMPIIPVVAWPYITEGINTAEHKQIEENGANESQYLRLATDVYDFDPNVVWVGDTTWGYGWNKWCGVFLKVIKEAKERRRQLGIPYLLWPIYIVDFSDYPIRQRCRDIESEMGRDLVFYSKRSIVDKRKWDEKAEWVSFGERVNLTGPPSYQHTPLTVRTDTIGFLNQALLERNLSLADPIEQLERKVDVSHFWPMDHNGVNPIYCELRDAVSRTVFLLGNTTDLNVFVGLKGDAVRTGRRGVKMDYIEGLLESKIVVVTQRDGWEDHYRLFEALIGGAMVMTDRMLSLPEGLVNGTSIVEFASADDLRNQILYYIEHAAERQAIARAGREVAMMRHRSWHRMEEIIFGRILSDCTHTKPVSRCPYIVHANEARRRRR